MPELGAMFVHHDLVNTVFSDVEPEDNHMFQRLDIPALASLLNNLLDEDKYRTAYRHIPWSPDDENEVIVLFMCFVLIYIIKTMLHRENS